MEEVIYEFRTLLTIQWFFSKAQWIKFRNSLTIQWANLKRSIAVSEDNLSIPALLHLPISRWPVEAVFQNLPCPQVPYHFAWAPPAAGKLLDWLPPTQIHCHQDPDLKPVVKHSGRSAHKRSRGKRGFTSVSGTVICFLSFVSSSSCWDLSIC